MSDAKLTAEESCRHVLKTIADACDQEALARADGYIFRYVQEETVLRDCGQRGVCRTPPGCARHWEERNRELLRENEVLRSNSDHLSSENASLARQVESMAMRIESLAEELAKPEDVRLREVLDSLDGRAVIFDGLGVRVAHLLDEMDEWIARAGAAERRLKKAEEVVMLARQLTAYSWEDRLEDCEVSDAAKHDSRELSTAIWFYDQEEKSITADGKSLWKSSPDDPGFMSDGIGLRIPAVPTEEGDSFWGYTSVPRAGVDWWKRLPTRPTALRERMTMDEYQRAAMRTTIHQRGAADPKALAWNALGVAGEAGEVADLIKKHVGHGHALDRAKLTRELGDVLWYVAALAHDIGVDMSEVAAVNVEKLKARYPDGWDPARSQNREAGDV